MVDIQKLKQLHKYSYQNQESCKKSESCGCFYCLKIFPSTEVNRWVKDKPPTALCPYCEIDSVLCDYDVPLTVELLKSMNEYWFNQ